MKIAILGGSFNPLHIGHAMLAETIVTELKYDKVLFVPTGIPPHKELQSGATTEQRLEMVKKYCESYPKDCFMYEDCEITRGGVSYTYDTVKYIIEKYKHEIEGKPALLMGEEIAAEFHKWKNPDEIAEMVDIIIVPRYPDYYGFFADNAKNRPVGHFNGDFNTKFDKQTFKYPCKLLDIPMVPVSSTDIRARIASGKSFRYLVPPAIYEYIVNNVLYDYISDI